MQYRSPTRHDIGKTVEVSDDGETWIAAEYCGELQVGDGYPYYGLAREKSRFYKHCRVPYSSPDPIAELSIAADLCLDHGMEEAARVLMAEAEKRKQPPKRQPYFDPTTVVDRTILKPSNTGTHLYPGCSDIEHFYTSDCAYGCGCWMGSSGSGGPDGVDPFGNCPNNTPNPPEPQL